MSNYGYGSGIKLDENFDFVVDETGDVSGETNLQELFKDLSFNISSALEYGEGVDRPETISNGVVGKPFTNSILSDVEIVVAKIIKNDVRISDVLSVNASPSDENPNTLIINTRVSIDVKTENFEFVINLN